MLFLAPMKTGRTTLNSAKLHQSKKEGKGRGKVGQIMIIAVSSFGV